MAFWGSAFQIALLCGQTRDSAREKAGPCSRTAGMSLSPPWCCPRPALSSEGLCAPQAFCVSWLEDTKEGNPLGCLFLMCAIPAHQMLPIRSSTTFRCECTAQEVSPESPVTCFSWSPPQLLACVCAAMILRRHLMVWKVFAPK